MKKGKRKKERYILVNSILFPVQFDSESNEKKR